MYTIKSPLKGAGNIENYLDFVYRIILTNLISKTNVINFLIITI